MKKFRFSLDTVLTYKQQIQDMRQREHAEAVAQLRGQEDLVDGLEGRYRTYGDEYAQRCQAGLQMTEVLLYQSGLRAMEHEIRQETERLELLRTQEERRRDAVIEAKRETASIDKLKEKKLKEYQKALDKAEELQIEEFVSMERIRGSGSQG